MLRGLNHRTRRGVGFPVLSPESVPAEPRHHTCMFSPFRTYWSVMSSMTLVGTGQFGGNDFRDLPRIEHSQSSSGDIIAIARSALDIKADPSSCLKHHYSGYSWPTHRPRSRVQTLFDELERSVHREDLLPTTSSDRSGEQQHPLRMISTVDTINCTSLHVVPP